MKSEKGKTQQHFDYDKRVRERLIASGQLDPKVVERYLADLPDLESQSESLPYEQPALSGSDDDDQGGV